MKDKYLRDSLSEYAGTPDYLKKLDRDLKLIGSRTYIIYNKSLYII